MTDSIPRVGVQPSRVAKKILKSISAAGIASAMCSPFEVVCAQRQTQRLNSYRWCKHFANVYRSQGLSGFYQGLGANILGRGLFYAGFFPLFDELQSRGFGAFASGYGASCVVSALSNPFYVVKTRRQIEAIAEIKHPEAIATEPKRSLINTFRYIARTEGVRGLFAGYDITLLKNSELGIQMGIIEYLRSSDNYSPVLYPLVVFVAKFTATTITYPLETIRTNQRLVGAPTAITILHNIVRIDGVRGLYRGFGLYALKSIPSTIITFGLYEAFKMW